MQSNFSVANKRIAITGGAGVLGSAMAKNLAAGGAYVCVLDNEAERAKQVCLEITDNGGKALAIETDVLDREQVESAAVTAIEAMGGVDGLINGAGGNQKEATATPDQPFFDIPAESIRFVFDLNLVGTVLPSQVFGRHMAERGDGIILNVSSMCAFTPLTKVAFYSAAKAAVSNFTKWLAVHMNQNYDKAIRVNAIAPGFFLTEQNRYLLTQKETGDLTARGRQILEHTPMERFGKPEDLFGTVNWLISDASKFITGIVVPIDGGFSAFSGV